MTPSHPAASEDHPPSEDATTFVLEHTRVEGVALLPSIRLRQASGSFLEWRTTEGELAARGLSLPFWAFAWPGGIAVARYLLDHPKIVAGQRVVDIGSGSGLIAIAAAQAGAAEVVANDVAFLASAAVEVNAALNKVDVSTSLEDLLDRPDHPLLTAADVIVSGDVAYEGPMAERAFRFFRQLAGQGKTVYVGDPGRAHLPSAGLKKVAEYEVPVARSLELTDRKITTIWRVSGPEAA